MEAITAEDAIEFLRTTPGSTAWIHTTVTKDDTHTFQVFKSEAMKRLANFVNSKEPYYQDPEYFRIFRCGKKIIIG